VSATSDRYLAWDSATLDRAAEHGCLDENIETGDPTVCAGCVTSPDVIRAALENCVKEDDK